MIWESTQFTATGKDSRDDDDDEKGYGSTLQYSEEKENNGKYFYGISSNDVEPRCIDTLLPLFTKVKLNNFPKFERPAKIDLSELFFGRFRGYVDFFCHFLLLYDHKTLLKSRLTTPERAKKKRGSYVKFEDFGTHFRLIHW
jgi:hypothetical protein